MKTQKVKDNPIRTQRNPNENFQIEQQNDASLKKCFNAMGKEDKQSKMGKWKFRLKLSSLNIIF